MTASTLGSDPAPLLFEHLVQVNDPRDPRIEPLSRRQVWMGLLLRAELPRYFMPWLEHTEITKLADGSWERELDFGTFRVRDRVHFEEETSVRYDIAENGSIKRANVTMRIEEPFPGELFVRFLYEIQSDEHDAQSPLAAFVKGAYRQADEETVAGIRILAASNVLDTPLTSQ